MDKNLKRTIRRASNINSVTLLLFYVLIIIFSLGEAFILPEIVNPDSPDFKAIENIVGYSLQYIAAVPLVLLVFRLLSRKDSGSPKLKECFCKPQMPAGWIVRWIFMIIGLIYTVSIISNMFFIVIQAITGIELHPADFTAENTPLGWFANLFAMVILAPFFEELMFRAALYRNAERFGAWSMAIMLGITFGLWHMNYQQTFYTAALGVFSCFLISKTKSVIPSLLLHCVMNFIGAVQSIAVGAIDIERIQSMDTEYMADHFGWVILITLIGFLLMGIAVAGVIMFIIELSLHKDSFRLENNCPEISGAKAFGVYLSAPATILLMLFMIFFTVKNALYR